MEKVEDKIQHFIEHQQYSDIANLLLGMSPFSRKSMVQELIDNPGIFLSNFDLKYKEVEVIAGCILGQYINDEKTIFIKLTGNKHRDLFTICHEIGHYIIETSEEWLDASYTANIGSGRSQIEEKIADLIASEILIPSTYYREVLDGSKLSANSIKMLYSKLECSISALLFRIQSEYRNTRDVIIGYASLEGELQVSYSLNFSNSSVLPLSAEIEQEPLKEIAENLKSTGVYQGFPEKQFVSSRGEPRVGFRVDAVLMDGNSGFIFLLEPTKSSRSTSIVYSYCSSCGDEIEDVYSCKKCENCNQPVCGSCYKCTCSQVQVRYCSGCFMELSVIESSEGKEYCQNCV